MLQYGDCFAFAMLSAQTLQQMGFEIGFRSSIAVLYVCHTTRDLHVVGVLSYILQRLNTYCPCLWHAGCLYIDISIITQY